MENISLPNLKNLTDASFCSLISECPEVESINISGCSGLTNESLYSVAQHCHNLVWLHLNGCYKITDEGVKTVMSQCPRLFKILVKDCDLTNSLFQDYPDAIGLSSDGSAYYSSVKGSAFKGSLAVVYLPDRIKVPARVYSASELVQGC